MCVHCCHRRLRRLRRRCCLSLLIKLTDEPSPINERATRAREIMPKKLCLTWVHECFNQLPPCCRPHSDHQQPNEHCRHVDSGHTCIHRIISSRARELKNVYFHEFYCLQTKTNLIKKKLTLLCFELSHMSRMTMTMTMILVRFFDLSSRLDDTKNCVDLSRIHIKHAGTSSKKVSFFCFSCYFHCRLEVYSHFFFSLSVRVLFVLVHSFRLHFVDIRVRACGADRR